MIYYLSDVTDSVCYVYVFFFSFCGCGGPKVKGNYRSAIWLDAHFHVSPVNCIHNVHARHLACGPIALIHRSLSSLANVRHP